jgi:hypothetical protein
MKSLQKKNDDRSYGFDVIQYARDGGVRSWRQPLCRSHTDSVS